MKAKQKVEPGGDLLLRSHLESPGYVLIFGKPQQLSTEQSKYRGIIFCEIFQEWLRKYDNYLPVNQCAIGFLKWLRPFSVFLWFQLAPSQAECAQPQLSIFVNRINKCLCLLSWKLIIMRFSGQTQFSNWVASTKFLCSTLWRPTAKLSNRRNSLSKEWIKFMPQDMKKVHKCQISKYIKDMRKFYNQ